MPYKTQFISAMYEWVSHFLFPTEGVLTVGCATFEPASPTRANQVQARHQQCLCAAELLQCPLKIQ
jgi:hypothetical protein